MTPSLVSGDSNGVVGRVKALFRYPVKSMLGETVESSYLSSRGLLGDRSWALIDSSDGKLASAKNPKKWGALLQCRARLQGDPIPDGPAPLVLIELPDGREISSEDPGANRILSEVAGRQIEFCSMSTTGAAAIEEVWPDDKGPQTYGVVVQRDEGELLVEIPAAFQAPGTFFDFSAVHLITSSTLDRMSELYPEGRWDQRRFRPNILIETNQSGLVENSWPGRDLVIGETRLSALIVTPRCVMTTLAQEDLPKDSGILRSLAQENRISILGLGELPCAGLYLSVVNEGKIVIGDAVRIV